MFKFNQIRFSRSFLLVALLLAFLVLFFWFGKDFFDADRAGKPSTAGEPMKVGFVYVGPVSDHGWTYRHDQGRKAVEARFGDKVKTAFVESVNEGADAERVIRFMADQGNKVIFTTSFGFMNPTVKVAKEFPDVKFMHATGYKRGENVGTYNARFYEGRYPVGMLAGRMTQSNVIGYVASFPIPEVIRGINATILGARSVNPEAEIRVVWVSTWYDPSKEADAAKTLINQGADVILQHTDSPAPLQIAEERGVYGIGQASDMRAFAPEAQLTAIIDNWNPYYVEQVGKAIDGDWKSHDLWFGLKAKWVELAPIHETVPDAVQKEVLAKVEAIKTGAFHPFQGPIKAQDGSPLVPAGAVMPDGDLLGLNVYVEGVIGQIPQ